MSLTSHLTELRKKHDVLSKRVEAEARNPAIDSIALTEMKKQKLAIKQQIERLSLQATH